VQFVVVIAVEFASESFGMSAVRCPPSFLLVLTGLTEIIPSAQALECSDKMVKGSYGSLFSGSTRSGVIAETGVFSADGNGAISGSDALSLAGTIMQRTITGTYSVLGNCTVTVTLTDNYKNITHFFGTIVHDGREIFFVETDATTAVSGSLKKLIFEQDHR
jgi:hypothetical protein